MENSIFSYWPFPCRSALIVGRNRIALIATPIPIPQQYRQKDTTKSVIPIVVPEAYLPAPLYFRTAESVPFTLRPAIKSSRKKYSNKNQIPENRQLTPAIYQLQKIQKVTASTSLQIVFL